MPGSTLPDTARIHSLCTRSICWRSTRMAWVCRSAPAWTSWEASTRMVYTVLARRAHGRLHQVPFAQNGFHAEIDVHLETLRRCHKSDPIEFRIIFQGVLLPHLRALVREPGEQTAVDREVGT